MIATLVQMADQAAKAACASDHGVIVSVTIGTAAPSFVIWTVKNSRLIRHKLDCASTSADRLTAHVQGFVNNIKGIKS